MSRNGVPEKISHVKLRKHTRTSSCLVTIGLSYVTTPFCLKQQYLAKAGKSPSDKRGKSESANKFGIDKLEIIINHIESFPTKLSQYAGKAREYLDARLCTKALNRMFIDKHPGICSPAFFYDFFNENYNFRFGMPQINCCCTCEELNVKLESPHLKKYGQIFFSLS